MSVWDNLDGQGPVVRQLQREVATGEPTHAWLFTGPPGSGRSNAARAFAAALLCERGDAGTPGCGQCKGCLTTLAGTHADLTVVATDKVTITIDEVRRLVAKSQDKPVTGKWRVLIVEDADRMAERTTNVLLKALEEPASRTLWILCAPSPADVLVTIRSRCRPVGLRVPPVEDVARLLQRRDGVPADLADYAARVSQGHVGIARWLARSPEARARRREILLLPSRISTVGQAARAAEELLAVATREAQESIAHLHEQEKAALVRALGLGEEQKIPPYARQQVKKLEDDQKRRATRSQKDVLDRTMLDLMSWYRDLLVVQVGAGIDLVNDDLRDRLLEEAAASSPEDTLRRMDAIGLARTRLGTNAAPLLTLEALLLALR